LAPLSKKGVPFEESAFETKEIRSAIEDSGKEAREMKTQIHLAIKSASSPGRGLLSSALGALCHCVCTGTAKRCEAQFKCREGVVVHCDRRDQ
jgi:hypothetical protein